MRAVGINYDTGFLPNLTSRPTFDPDAIRHDLTVIRRDLHCDAVRISGADPDRLRLAAEHAATEGLEIWLSPFPVDLPPASIQDLFLECATLAESLARSGADVVLVTGCELSAFATGFIPGENHRARLHAMTTADLDWWLSLGPVVERLNNFLAESVAAIRPHFTGRITYASATWEPIDWSPFDIVAVDAYRAAHNAPNFRAELREHFKHGKPVAITEYGTCAYRSAADRGSLAWQVPDGATPDESEQVRYFTELLDIFTEEGVDTALWFTFANFNRPAAQDLASYGIVRLDTPTHWHPKQIFHTMATRYSERPSS